MLFYLFCSHEACKERNDKSELTTELMSDLVDV